MALDLNFIATGIGSVPSLDIRDTCRHILQHLPMMPFWPQFVQRSYLEDMNIQFSEGLPLLEVKSESRKLTVGTDDLASALVTFYDHFLAEDREYFAISPEYAPGLYEILELIGEKPEEYGPYLKGQTVGPVTFCAGISGPSGKSVLHQADILDALVKGLAIKALWQVEKLSQTGKKPVIFLDEPSLSGFGSAFSAIQRDEVVRLLKEVIDYLRERSDALIGIHCCGNTDWPMLIEAGPDIINFDAFEYLKTFLLYPTEITRFINAGGSIAWGIVPTTPLTAEESAEHLHAKLSGGLDLLYQWGLDSELVRRHSLLTPACGTGSIDATCAEEALEHLSLLSKKYRTQRSETDIS